MSLEKSPSVDEVLNPEELGDPLKISVNATDSRTHVTVAGELDGSTAPFLRQTLFEVAADLQGDLLLDIGQLTAIDSSGLSLLIALHKKLLAQRCNLIVFSPTPMARHLFEVARLTEVLWIEPFERRRRHGR